MTWLGWLIAALVTLVAYFAGMLHMSWYLCRTKEGRASWRKQTKHHDDGWYETQRLFRAPF